MENSDIGLEKISQDEQVRIENIRRIVTEAYIAGHNEGFRKAQQLRLEIQPNLTEQELYYSRQQWAL